MRRAVALDDAFRHDGDAVSEDVGLVHEVRRQDHGAASLLALQDVPRLAARLGIHAARRLVQDHRLNQRSACTGTYTSVTSQIKLTKLQADDQLFDKIFNI